MDISATMVRDLREKTGVGMMECKKALQENQGDMEKAIVWLRERGLSRAAKKADRIATEGTVVVVMNPEKSRAALLELNCETDFVSKNEDFQSFARAVAEAALKQSVTTVEGLGALRIGSQTVESALTELISRIGENMKLRRIQLYNAKNGCVGGYVHLGGRIGTVVVLEGSKSAKTQELAKDLAMHVAAAAPRYLLPEDVAPAELEQERQIALKKLLEEKKPENLVDKIVDGQLKKFYKEVCLLEQAYIRDPNVSVAKLLSASGEPVKVSAFGRFQLGEGLEKKSEDFAKEVAAQLK